MKSSLLITVIFVLFLNQAHAQVTGTYKISKASPDTRIEQIQFNEDGTADIVSLIYDFAAKRYGPASKEIRVDCKIRDSVEFDKLIQKVQGIPGAESEEIKLTKFRKKGYDKFVVLYIPEGGSTTLVKLAGKGDELVDVDYGYIFKKSGWF